MESEQHFRGGREAPVWPWTLLALGLLIAWDASSLDLPLARLMADGHEVGRWSERELACNFCVTQVGRAAAT